MQLVINTYGSYLEKERKLFTGKERCHRSLSGLRKLDHENKGLKPTEKGKKRFAVMDFEAVEIARRYNIYRISLIYCYFAFD